MPIPPVKNITELLNNYSKSNSVPNNRGTKYDSSNTNPLKYPILQDLQNLKVLLEHLELDNQVYNILNEIIEKVKRLK